MTNKECIGQLKYLQKCYQRLINFDKSLTKAEIASFNKRTEVFNVAIKALEQEDIFDKIRDEVEEYKSRQLTLAIGVEDLEKGKQIALEYVLAILDKYKTESKE